MIRVSNDILTPHHEVAAVANLRQACDGIANNEDPGTAAKGLLAKTLH